MWAGAPPRARPGHRQVARHTAGFRDRWSAAETRIVTHDGADIGWLRAAVEPDALMLPEMSAGTLIAPYPTRGVGCADEML